MIRRGHWALGCVVALLAALPAAAQDEKQIAQEAYVYAFPMLMHYGTMYEFSIDQSSSQYKAPFNQIANESHVATPADTAIVTPNSDTPYSLLMMDLRAEPIVLCVPEIDEARYYSVQLIDMYTFNFGYVGSRATGNGAGCYAVSGPDWKGATPAGVANVFPSETQFAFAIYRTQLFDPADIENVKKIQAGYTVQPLSAFLDQPAPPAAPEIEWPKFDKKLTMEEQPFETLNFLLQFAPPVPEETALRARFEKIGIAPGKPFDASSESASTTSELKLGVGEGFEQIQKRRANLGKEVNGWHVNDFTLNRAAYDGDWVQRAAVAMAGIYANDTAEAFYPILATDSDGKKPDASTGRYTLTFPAGQLPPVNAFWSVTMYDGKTQLLVENPIDRYLINSPMLPGLKKNADGSLTLYLQKDSPGADKQSNWLPAPNGPIYVVMRLYWPKPEATDGKWQPPPVVAVP
jgi:hypothetical protein